MGREFHKLRNKDEYGGSGGVEAGKGAGELKLERGDLMCQTSGTGPNFPILGYSDSCYYGSFCCHYSSSNGMTDSTPRILKYRDTSGSYHVANLW